MRIEDLRNGNVGHEDVAELAGAMTFHRRREVERTDGDKFAVCSCGRWESGYAQTFEEHLAEMVYRKIAGQLSWVPAESLAAGDQIERVRVRGDGWKEFKLATGEGEIAGGGVVIYGGAAACEKCSPKGVAIGGGGSGGSSPDASYSAGPGCATQRKSTDAF